MNDLITLPVCLQFPKDVVEAALALLKTFDKDFKENCPSIDELVNAKDKVNVDMTGTDNTVQSCMAFILLYMGAKK